MSDALSQNRSVRNEQVLRKRNINVKNGIKKFFRGDKKVQSTPVAFTCECSVLDCNKHVKVSIDTYEELHKRKDRFTIAKGHETPTVEAIVAKKPGYSVVEKHELKP